jgi:hypothetical protein
MTTLSLFWQGTIAAPQDAMALLLIPWVCLSLIICLALLRATARPMSKPKPLSTSAPPGPLNGCIASLPPTAEAERECMAAKEAVLGYEGRRNPDSSKQRLAPLNVLVAGENPGI